MQHEFRFAPDHAAARPVTEDPAYLSRQLVTCIGNKRALLGPIGEAVARVRARLGGRPLRTADLFSGSGAVSRFLKAHSSYLAANDLEEYAAVVARCYLRNRSTVDEAALTDIVADLHDRAARDPQSRGFVEELYAPRDDSRIEPGERVFYTRENARRIDSYRRLIGTAPADFQDLLLGPLLSRASVHANTAGVFKGFYKDRRTGVGQFGGSGCDALTRILAPIVLEAPVLSRFECEYAVTCDDANAVAGRLSDLDLAYIDPPYNQHPYGSNYFMLNLIARNERPGRVSAVSGIPADWTRSAYNVRSRSLPLVRDLVDRLDSRFLLVSFNDEGFINPAEMRSLLERAGRVEVYQIVHNAFRGSRSFANRSIHVTEQLFLVER